MTLGNLIAFLNGTGKGWEGVVELGRGTMVPLKYQFDGIRYSHVLNSARYGVKSDVTSLKLKEQ